LDKLLIHYSLELQPGQQLYLRTNPLAEELAMVVYAEAIRAGGHVFVLNSLPGAQEILLRFSI
jgi:leucyl aminopeptidase (aminopeptidase T)